MAGTRKHVGASWSNCDHLGKALEMLHIIAGSEAAWRARPFVSQSNCFFIATHEVRQEALECLRVAVEGGMPVCRQQDKQAPPPATLAVRSARPGPNARRASDVNAIEPGAPAIIGAWPFVSDLRTGAMSGGSPEQGLISSGCAQLGLYFDLPFGTACGMTDANMPDFQAGAERAQTLMPPALAGSNLIYEAAGMYSSLLGVCPESLILDNDVLGATLRAVRGIEVNEKTLGFDDLAQVCLGDKGHYLGSDHTLAVMQSEYLYPEVGNRFSPTVWEASDKPLAIDNAIRTRDHILATYVPTHIPPEVDAEIRAKFPIRLMTEDLVESA